MTPPDSSLHHASLTQLYRELQHCQAEFLFLRARIAAIRQSRFTARISRMLARSLESHLDRFLKRLNHVIDTHQTDLSFLNGCLFRNRYFIRLYRSHIIRLYTAQSWQSPVQFSLRLRGLHGQQSTTLNYTYEYQRTIYDVSELEAHLAALVTPCPGTRRWVFATSSGMSAFATIWTALSLSGQDYVMVGHQSYFEILNFLKLQDRHRLRFVSETDWDTMSICIQDQHCKGLIVDLIGNNQPTHVFELPRFVTLFSKIARKTPFHLVLDTSISGPCFQPAIVFRSLVFPQHLHFLCHRSLQKYDQDGEDGVTGGTITYLTYPDSPEHALLQLNQTRPFIGALIPEQHLVALLTYHPDRPIYRIRRHYANTYRISRFFRQASRHYADFIAEISYPGVDPSHRHLSRGMGLPVGSSMVFIAFHDTGDCPKIRAYLTRVLEKAREKKVYLFESASFGFNDTHYMFFKEQHMIRIAPGIEDAYHFSRIIECFSEALPTDTP